MKLDPISAAFWLGALAFAAAVACQSAAEKPEAAAPPPLCDAAPGHLKAFGELAWVAVKNGDALVTGHQKIQGTLDATGEKLVLDLAFDPKPHSGIDLRDDRIADIVLGRGKDVLAFHAEIAAKLPDPGVTLAVPVKGTFKIAGAEHPMEVPARIAGEGESAYEVQGEFAMDLRSELALGSRIDEMLALVNARMNDDLEVRYRLRLEEACKP